MACTMKVLLAAIFLLISVAEWAQCARVQFYGETNYKGFIEEKILSGQQELSCINLKSGSSKIRSVKTEKCLIMYQLPDCKGGTTSNFNERVIFRIDQDQNDVNWLNSKASSFHVCSQKLAGGPQLDIDFYKGAYPGGTSVQPEHFRGVCGCRNVPSRLAGGKSFPIYIRNHGNWVLLYEGEDCRGTFISMQPGEYGGDHTGEYRHDIKSFKPTSSYPCYRLAASIYKFQFSNGTSSIGSLATEKVHLATDSTIRNNGASEISQTFKVSSKITETVEFSIAKSLTTMDSAGVEAGVEMTAEVGVPLVTTAEVKVSLKTNYQWSRTEGSETKNSTTASKEETIEIEQQIKIPPCKICKVSTYVRKIKAFPIKYTAYAKVSAPEGFEPLTTAQLKSLLPAGMKYVKDINRNTIAGATEGIMHAEFGLQSFIDVECERNLIPGCTPLSHARSNNNHQHYEVPIRANENLRSTPSSPPPNSQSFLKNAFYLFLKHFN